MSSWNQGTERATSCYGPLHDLDAKQAFVLAQLVAGATQQEAADAAGVHRVTVSRWTRLHPGFVAAMNRQRADRAIQLEKLMRDTVEMAVVTVSAAIAAGDAGLALQWLRICGMERWLQDRFLPVESSEVVQEVRDAMPQAYDTVIDTRPTPEAAERALSAALRAPLPGTGLGLQPSD